MKEAVLRVARACRDGISRQYTLGLGTFVDAEGGRVVLDRGARPR